MPLRYDGQKGKRADQGRVGRAQDAGPLRFGAGQRGDWIVNDGQSRIRRNGRMALNS
ncbi:MAG: hypothetical protein Kow0059_06770 [Candidatus Sumerlaeia bacterium]